MESIRESAGMFLWGRRQGMKALVCVFVRVKVNAGGRTAKNVVMKSQTLREGFCVSVSSLPALKHLLSSLRRSFISALPACHSVGQVMARAEIQEVINDTRIRIVVGVKVSSRARAVFSGLPKLPVPSGAVSSRGLSSTVLLRTVGQQNRAYAQ